jgi:cysteine protease ATG4
LSLFNDEPTAPFGIHNLVSSTIRFGVKVGEWAKPSLIAAAIASIFSKLRLGCLVVRDLAFSLEKVDFPALVLIPGLLGLKDLDLAYLPFLNLCLCIKGSLGFVSGYKGSAYFIAGFDSNFYFYFDPHTTHDPVLKESDFHSFFSIPTRKIKHDKVNPSILIGFLVGDRNELDDLIATLMNCSFSPIGVIDDPEAALDCVFDPDELE